MKLRDIKIPKEAAGVSLNMSKKGLLLTIYEDRIDCYVKVGDQMKAVTYYPVELDNE